MCVCVCVCVCVCICICVCVWNFCLFLFFVCFNLHDKALLKALVYIIIQFNYNVMGVVNVVMFYLVIISDATYEFLPLDKNK